MTEPVAYKAFDNDSKREFLRFTPSPFNDNVPLYTKEQIHPRVKMTQAEFEMIKIIKQKNNLLSDALNSTAFFGDEKQQSEQQIELANLFINLDLDNPDETIEIVPTMKWFVVVTNPIVHAGWTYLSVDGIKRISYDAPKSEAKKFDTKEKAEEWLNPLTKAVQLPVEEQ